MADTKHAETLERRRAKHAYEELGRMKNRSKVCTRVQGLPIAVRSQGLTVAVATLLKEDRPESRVLADLLAGWVLDEAGVAGDAGSGRSTGAKLLERAVKAERAEYLAMQSEALAFLEHVKRLASALEKSS